MTSRSFTTPRWVKDELGLDEAPPQKAGSRLALHTHPAGRPTNDKFPHVLIWICSYIPWNSRSACMHARPVHPCEAEDPQDLDCKYSVSPLVLLYIRPYFPFRHWVRAQHRLCQAKLQISAFSRWRLQCIWDRNTTLEKADSELVPLIHLQQAFTYWWSVTIRLNCWIWFLTFRLFSLPPSCATQNVSYLELCSN